MPATKFSELAIKLLSAQIAHYRDATKAQKPNIALQAAKQIMPLVRKGSATEEEIIKVGSLSLSPVRGDFTGRHTSK